MRETSARFRTHLPPKVLLTLVLAVVVLHVVTLTPLALAPVEVAAPTPVAMKVKLLAPVPATPPPRSQPPRKKAPQPPARPPLPTPPEMSPSSSVTSEPQAASTADPASSAGVSTAPTDPLQGPTAPDTPDVLVARQLPPPAVLEYELQGMDRGLNYSASSTLQWQYNEQQYALSLTVKAFLLGSRQWRSTGLLGPDGLVPDRFSDKRKKEVATHFDRKNQQIIFSSKQETVPLLAGAQDQISLFIQLGGAVNTAPDQFDVGTTLNVQTVTPRSADVWRITLAAQDALSIMGHTRVTRHWVCAPRGPYDSKLEFWTDPALTGLPVRIRITQANGNFIDMTLSDLLDAPALPAS